MKHVNFTQVSIRNFLSIGEQPLVLDFKPGLHIITGINRDKTDRRNGIGKTSVVESVYFAVFGSTIRELKKDLIPNNVTNSTCEVKLNFNVSQGETQDEYCIIRTLNPSKLYFHKNNKDITRDSIKSTEEDIHEVLSASPSIFENCVIMTLNNTTPFMAKSKVDKRKFIEGIFNLEIFGQMLAAAREDHTARKRVYEIELTKMEDNERTANGLKTQRTNILEARQQKIASLQQRKTSGHADKQKLLDQMSQQMSIDVDVIKDQIQQLNKAVETCEYRIEQLAALKSKLHTNIRRHQQDISALGTDQSKCPVCLHVITDDDKSHIQSEQARLEQAIIKHQASFTECETKLVDTKNKKTTITATINKLNNKLNEAALLAQQQANTTEKIAQLSEWLGEIDADIEVLKSDTTDVDGVLEESLKHVEKARQQVLTHRKHLELLETVKYIVSEEGVKSYIVNKILELFNNVLQSYLSKMDANCRCTFDEYFEEEIINDKHKLCSYFNFSGAERKNIDFACLFAFMDMRRLQGNVTYNISIYDELFDSSLDERGVELVTNILKDRVLKHNECVMVISHRKESIQHATGDVIFLEKKNGITSRIDYNPFTTN